MEDERLSELLEQITTILSKKGLAISIIKKPRELVYKPEVYAKHYWGNNIKERREEMGLTPMQLAKKMGVDRNIVIRAERKGHFHTETTMQKFADFFGCEIKDLLVGDEDEREG